ncbi:MAG: hypothetical protein V1789_03845 [PVC group bacterium]
MKTAIKPLTPVVYSTSILLVIGAFLVVLGIFNGSLEWDIFSPRVEAVLWGIFYSSVALGSFGVALSVVLGIHQIVTSFRFLTKERHLPEPSRFRYISFMLWLTAIMAGIVVICAFVNYRVQIHRTDVFTRLATEQMAHFGPKLARLLQPVSSPPQDHVPRKIYDLIHTLDNLSFVSRTTLYLPDPEDDSALWGYTAWRDYKKEDGFARFFIARDFEKAMEEALDGNPELLQEFNRRREFTRYFIVFNEKGSAVAVIRIDGNPRENFRDYAL